MGGIQRVRLSNASLITAKPSAIYGAIITADRLLYHPANILGRNPIAAQLLDISPGHRQRPGEEVCWQRIHLPDTACPWHPCPTHIYNLGGGSWPSALPTLPRAVGGGEDDVGHSNANRVFPRKSAPIGIQRIFFSL